MEVANSYVQIDSKTLCSITISDHWPVLLELSNPNLRTRSGWFHADHSLFKFEAVKASIEDNFHNAFGSIDFPSKAWSTAVRDTQTCLKKFKKQATAIRQKKRNEITLRILNLQNSILPGNPPNSELQALKAELRLEELLEAHRALIFMCESWAGKIDKPNKDMFRLLKQKQARDTVPNLVDDSGTTFTAKEDNLDFVFNFYNDIFASPPPVSYEKTFARARIARVNRCPYFSSGD